MARTRTTAKGKAKETTADKDKTIAALRAQVKKLQETLRLARGPVLRFDVDLKRRISNANEALAVVTGRSIKKLEGLEFDQIIHGRSVETDVLFHHLLKGTPLPGPKAVFMTFTLDETGRRFRLSFRRKKDQRGAITGFRVTGKETGWEFFEKLADSGDRHAHSIYQAVDSLRMGLLHAFNTRGGSFTQSTRIGGLTNGMARGLGYRVEAVPGGRRKSKPELDQQPVTRLLTPETIRALGGRLADGEEGWIEGEILAQDGSRRPARFSIAQHADPWIKRSHFTILIADRSEDEKVLRRLHESLVESEEKYRSLFESAADPIFLEDFDGNILDANKHACELYGYTHQEMCALNARDLVPEEDVPLVRTIAKALKQQGHMHAEGRNRRRDGSLFDIELSATVVQIAGRDVVHVTCRDVTKRKQAQRDTLIANERLQYLLSSTPAVIYTSRTSGDYGATFISDNVTDIVGYTPQDFTERSRFWTDHIHPDDVQRVFRELPHLFARGLHTHEYRFRRKDGAYIWVRDELRLVRDDEGKPIEIVGLWIDITERKRTEEALRASENRYRAIVEDQTELICRFRPDGTLTFVNEAYCRYFDKKPEELVGKKFLPLIPKKDKETVQRHIAALNRKHPVGTHEHRVTTPKGEIRWQQWTNRAIFDDHGVLTELQAVGRDVTERRRLEQERRQSEERLRILFERVADAIFVSDLAGVILDCNASACAMFGYAREELLALRPEDLVAEPFRPSLQAFGNEVRRRRQGITEAPAKRRDGSLFDCELSVTLVQTGEGGHIYVICRDITERKQLQHQLERAARLAAVGTLAAGVAHEINNPLAVISVDLLRMKRQYEDDPAIARLCSKLIRMTKRISGITGGLLTFSKARGGVLAKYPLHGALDGALELVRSRFDFEQKRLVRSYPKRLPSVWSDSDQLQQVFVNIAFNALEAMRAGDTLTVSAKTSRKDRTVTLRFADDGKGMTAEEVQRAFDPFYTTKETGSGLGLAISHSIVEGHNGQITITSEPGEGTTVSVILPVYEPPGSRTPTAPRHPNRKTQENS